MEIEEIIKEKLLECLITGANIEVLRINKKFYCLDCYRKNHRVISLKRLEKEDGAFNCIMCGSLKRYKK